MSFEEYLSIVKGMIDDLKAMSANLGLANTGDEYKIISELFTYKFLNDKLVYAFDHREDKDETFEEFVSFAGIDIPRMEERHLIKNLWHKQNEGDFNKTFDRTFVEINELNKDIYSVETATGRSKPLFEPLSNYIRDEGKELELAKRSINILDRHEFEHIYEGGFDYFSSVFEYLIKDYNKDSGKYAEYFTPLFAGNIMSDILLDDKDVKGVEIYDPAAGSGTLLLSLANRIGVNNCSIYSQDISQKSTQFLRINLILNDLVHSLNNVVEGDTILTPSHLDPNDSDEIRKFDYIVSNPPFNMDFSDSVESLKVDRYNRFFAGIPKIPKKEKEGMDIYLVFLQHVLSSLKDNGKAAVVVPTGFVTSKYTIQKNVKKEILKNKWLRGVIHMPSKIFATTSTSVSVIFIDKSVENNEVILVDASRLGVKKSIDGFQRTFLSEYEKNKIIDTFKEKQEEPEFSALVAVEDIIANEYVIQAGQYFDLKEEVYDFDADEELSRLKDEIFTTTALAEDLSKKLKLILTEEF